MNFGAPAFASVELAQLITFYVPQSCRVFHINDPVPILYEYLLYHGGAARRVLSFRFGYYAHVLDCYHSALTNPAVSLILYITFSILLVILTVAMNLIKLWISRAA